MTTTADFLVLALTCALVALFVALLWPSPHACDITGCPHKKR